MSNTHSTQPVLAGLIAATALLLTTTCQAREEGGNGEGAREGFGLGLAVMTEQTPYRDFDNKTEVWPLITYENRWIRVAGPGLDLKLGKTGPVAYALTASYAKDGYKASDSSYLDGMDERKGSAWLGGRVTWANKIANLSAAWQADASGNSNGQKFTLGAEHRFAFGDWGVSPRLKAIWQDRKYVDYYYGVRASEVRIDRTQYSGDSTVNGEFGTRVDYRLSPAQSVFLDLGVTALGSSIKDSPLVDRGEVFSARLGYSYHF